MNTAILSAASLMTITALVHVFWGGPEVMPSVQKASLPRPVRAVIYVIWHAVTVTLICIAGALFWLTWQDNPPLLWTISAIQIGFAGLFLWYGITQLRSIWIMPQWVVFLGVPAISIYWGG